MRTSDFGGTPVRQSEASTAGTKDAEIYVPSAEKPGLWLHDALRPHKQYGLLETGTESPGPSPVHTALSSERAIKVSPFKKTTTTYNR